MRECPICHKTGKNVLHNGYNGQRMCLFECPDCKHRYIDSKDLSVEWLDQYYLTQYRTDDIPYSHDRWESLAVYICNLSDNVLDIGGKDGELRLHLEGRGVRVDVAGVGDRIHNQYGCVVLSHVLEHVYNVSAMMQKAVSALQKGGILVVEVPIHHEYVDATEYDYHWQHVNKFRVEDLERLFIDNGISVFDSYELPDYREYKCWRIAGKT